MANPATAVIYFNRDPKSTAMAKDLAARVRNDGPNTLLVWADRFRDESNVDANARAVIIQESAPNAKIIATCYDNFAAGVEIHYVDDDGGFLEEDVNLGGESGAETVDNPDKADAPPDTPGDSETQSGQDAATEGDQSEQAPAT